MAYLDLLLLLSGVLDETAATKSVLECFEAFRFLTRTVFLCQYKYFFLDRNGDGGGESGPSSLL